MDEFARVVEWRPVSARWWGHRAEPMLHERLWGCSLPLSAAQSARQAWHEEGGFDSEEQAIAWRQVLHGTDESVRRGGGMEVAVSEAGAATVPLRDGTEKARTTFDSRGLPVRTDYSGDMEPEHYEHDAAGRLIAIDETESLWATAATERGDTGGRLVVEHDDQGPARIVAADGSTVWERPTEPWPAQLERGVDTIAQACVEAVRGRCQRIKAPPATEVFALRLTYVDQGWLCPDLGFGLEADRRACLATGTAGPDLTHKLLYFDRNHDGLDFIEDVLEPDLDQQLMRGACMHQAGDPYRAVLGELASRLAGADWAPELRPTPDFVVFIAEHDEGFAPKVESISEHNPPEQVMRWEESWPPGAPRDDEWHEMPGAEATS